jgi:hypothetical protein
VMSETAGGTVPLAESALALTRRWASAPVYFLPHGASAQATGIIADTLLATD